MRSCFSLSGSSKYLKVTVVTHTDTFRIASRYLPPPANANANANVQCLPTKGNIACTRDTSWASSQYLRPLAHYLLLPIKERIGCKLETLPKQFSILGASLTETGRWHRTASRRIRPESRRCLWSSWSLLLKIVSYLHIAWFGHISQPSRFTRNVKTTPWGGERQIDFISLIV